jgi:hypothetical protein
MSDTDQKSALSTAFPQVPLWQLGITELTGHNIEAEGRVKVNELLKNGWILLYIYILIYEEDGI